MTTRKILISCAALTLIVMLSAPLILKQQGIQQQAAKNLSNILGEQGSFGSIKWRWLPFPSLVIADFKHSDSVVSLNVPELIYYPNWLALLKKSSSLGKATLLNPKIHLNTGRKTPTSLPVANDIDLKLPNLNIEIVDGTITIPASSIASQFEYQPLTFRINADFHLEPNRLKFSLDGSANFTSFFQTQGRIDLTKQYYRLDLQAKDLNLLNILSNQQNMCKPQPSKFNLKINLEGLGLRNWQMNIFAPDADISSMVANQPVKIDGIDTISITRHDSDYFMFIKNLNFSKLAKSINGNIKSIVDDNSKRIWDIDLAAENIDLKRTRVVIPAIFKDNKYVNKVFDILRGGDANDVRFILKGDSEDFKHFSKYKIWATAEKLPIYIQEIGLYIDQTNGTVSIINGVLTGNNLTAELGTKNHGINGKLLMGLTATNHAFLLDLDLDVDLIDLQDVLSEIIANDDFQNELSNFEITSGRAQGNLLLADNLYNLETTVKIDRFYGVAAYDRIPWQFKIKGGELNVAPHQVSWSNLDVDYGPHKILDGKGLVNWQDGISFEFTSPGLAIDLGPLYDDFHIITNDKIILLNELSSVITNISGTASLKDTHVSGKITEPENWQYSTDIKTSFALSSPHMPPDTIVTRATAKVTNSKISYSGNFQFFDQQILMTGDYRHNNLHQWQGYTEFNGMIGVIFGKWLKGRSTLNKMFFPNLPFAVQKYKLFSSPSKKQLRLNGTIIANPKSAVPVTMKVDVNQLNKEQKYKISIKDGENTAVLSANISKRPVEQSLFTWQGNLTAKSLKTIFEHNFLDSGEITGVFSYLKANNTNLKHKFAGYLEAHDLQLSSENKFNDAAIKNLQINGEDNILKIRTLDASFAGERFHASGNITAEDYNYNLDLAVKADDIYWTPIRSVLDKILYSAEDIEQPSTNHTNLADMIKGSINFNISNFYYPKKLPIIEEDRVDISNITAPPAKKAKDIPTQPLASPIRQLLFSHIQGKGVFLGKDAGTKVIIESSDLCGLSIRGTWYNKQADRPSIYTIVKEDPQTPLLQETLPCLYTDHSLIEGPYTLTSQLIGKPGMWTDGFVDFESDQGIIRRMNLLSNIFSVINFTDLFTSYRAKNGDNTGLIYNDMIFKSRVEDNRLIIDQAVLKGKGVNISSQGEIDLENYNADLTFFVAPFKMIDSVVTNIPLIGKAIGGKKKSILTIPVAVEGPLSDPNITAMDPSSVGGATLRFIMETLTIPFRIFMPEKKIEYELKGENDLTRDKIEEKNNSTYPVSRPDETLMDGPG